MRPGRKNDLEAAYTALAHEIILEKNSPQKAKRSYIARSGWWFGGGRRM